MKTPVGTKQGVYGFAAGIVATLIIGFTWGGWVTNTTATSMANDRAQIAVVEALVPVCVAHSKQDPKAQETLAALTKAASYNRNDVLEKAGWATMPGTSTPVRGLATACATKLAAAS